MFQLISDIHVNGYAKNRYKFFRKKQIMQVESDLTAQLTRIRNTNTHKKSSQSSFFNESQVAARFDIFDRSVDQANYATNTHQSIGIFFSHFSK